MMKRKNSSSRLRHRLTLQEEVATPDTAGGYARSWDDVTDLWAEIMPISGRERLFAGKIQAETTHRIMLRYRGGVTTKHRLVFDSRIFSILAVINVKEEDELLEVMVAEGIA